MRKKKRRKYEVRFTTVPACRGQEDVLSRDCRTMSPNRLKNGALSWGIVSFEAPSLADVFCVQNQEEEKKKTPKTESRERTAVGKFALWVFVFSILAKAAQY